jgi:hypothetical protein
MTRISPIKNLATFALLRNGTRIFTDAADKRRFFTNVSAKIRFICVYPRAIHKSAKIGILRHL